MLRIGGLQKFSLIDFPGKMAAVIFTQGCDFRCPFCHNPDLVLPEKFTETISEKEILEFLEKRQDQLEGVVITGGEPTLQNGLGIFLRKIKDLGYSIKLDTNGNNPEVLQGLIEEKFIDYIAMDIKAPLEKYSQVAGVQIDQSKIKQSVDLILNSGLDYQFRTTVIKPFLNDQDLSDISSFLQRAKCYKLQLFSAKGDILDKSLLDVAHYDSDEFEQFKQKWQKN